LLTEVRICDDAISGGNALEAAFRKSNSCSRKPTASLTASGAAAYSAVLRLLVGTSVDSGSGREFRNGSKAGVKDNADDAFRA
jgi:hypothetical protein